MKFAPIVAAALLCALPSAAGAVAFSGLIDPYTVTPAGGQLASVTATVHFTLTGGFDAQGEGDVSNPLPPAGLVRVLFGGTLYTDFGELAADDLDETFVVANETGFEVNTSGSDSFTFDDPVLLQLFEDGFDLIANYDGNFSATRLPGFSGTISNRGVTATATYSFSYTFVGGDSPVPEPASWAMMISGFGLAGAAMRRQRARLLSPTA